MIMRLWDYREEFCNINGIVCLQSVLSFAIMGIVFHYLLEPGAERIVKKIDSKRFQIICLVLLVVYFLMSVFSRFSPSMVIKSCS